MKKLVAVSDIHAGSMYAALPPNFEAYDGTTKLWNPAQEYMWKCWEDFTWRAHEYDPDGIIVNGDCVEGPQRKSGGYEVTLLSPDDQIKAAVAQLQLLKDRCPRAKFYFCKGTGYHVGEWDGAEEAIATIVGGESYWSVGTGKKCREVLWLNVEGAVIEAAHHISGATGFYRMTSLDREGQWSAMASKDASKGIPKSELLIRSHLHFFGHIEHDSKEVIVTPCWKLGDRHSRKSGVHRFHPSLGGVFIEVDGSARKLGRSPFRIEKQLYSNPPVKVTEL